MYARVYLVVNQRGKGQIKRLIIIHLVNEGVNNSSEGGLHVRYSCTRLYLKESAIPVLSLHF